MSYQTHRVDGAGQIGFIAPEDAMPSKLAPNAWTRAHNIRFEGGDAYFGQGWITAGNGPVAASKTYMDYLLGFGGAWWLLYGGTTIHTLQEGDILTDVTRLSGPYTTGNNYWSMTNFKGIPVATNNADKPQAQYIDSSTVPLPTTKFVDLPGWYITDAQNDQITYDTMRCKLMETYKDFLVGANFLDWDGQRRSTRVWWSNAAETGLLPPDWDAHDPTSLSGYFDLPGDTGEIIAMKRLRDSVMIYTSQSVWRMDFVGGTFVMQFRRVAGYFGAYGPHSVVDFHGQHFVVTSEDVFVTDGSSGRSIADGRVRRWLFGRISAGEADTVFVAAHPEQSEIWIGIPVAEGATTCDTALVWQWEDNVWATRDLPNVSYGKALPALAAITQDSNTLTWNTIPASVDRWDDPFWDGKTWSGGAITTTAVYDYRLYTTQNLANVPILQMDIGTEHAGVVNYDSILERQSINIGGDELTQFVRSAYLRMGENAFPIDQTRTPYLSVAVGSQVSDTATPAYRTEREFSPKSDYRVTTRCRGRRHAVKIRANDINFSLAGYDLQFSQSGGR